MCLIVSRSASRRRSHGDASVSAFIVLSRSSSVPRMLTHTRADPRSRAVSTRVMVANPMRGSFISR
jgi:hypothetical protein